MQFYWEQPTFDRGFWSSHALGSKFSQRVETGFNFHSRGKGLEDQMTGAQQVHEYLDFAFQFTAPNMWKVSTECSMENCLLLNAYPPSSKAQNTIPHLGFTINAFAYPKRVENVDSSNLLLNFLQNFCAVQRDFTIMLSQGNTLVPVSRGSSTRPSYRKFMKTFCQTFQSHGIKTTSCDLEFQFNDENCHSKEKIQSAKAHFVAFFHPNRRYHYLQLLVWPKEENVYPIIGQKILCSMSQSFQLISFAGT